MSADKITPRDLRMAINAFNDVFDERQAGRTPAEAGITFGEHKRRVVKYMEVQEGIVGCLQKILDPNIGIDDVFGNNEKALALCTKYGIGPFRNSGTHPAQHSAEIIPFKPKN